MTNGASRGNLRRIRGAVCNWLFGIVLFFCFEDDLPPVLSYVPARKFLRKLIYAVRFFIVYLFPPSQN